MKNQQKRSRWWWLIPLALGASALLTSCGGQEAGQDWNGEPTGPNGERPAQCIDKDGDGFGKGCGNGADCDDGRKDITNQCYGCSGNATGCPCTPGQKIACGELTKTSDGQPACQMGEKVCASGRWSACQPKADSLIPLSEPLTPMGLGGSANSCDNNPCDPYCQHFPDDPDGTLTNDSGIVGSEAGLQLKPNEIDAGPPQACVNQHAEATRIPLDMYVMIDKSGSMWGGNRWGGVVTAITHFVHSSDSAGISWAINYFPSSNHGYSYCDYRSYMYPAVNWIMLPGGANAIMQNINAHHPGGGTPTRPALSGAIRYAKIRANAHPDHKVVVVLATDGQPCCCSNNTINAVRSVASWGVNGTPSIETYVIGVGTAVNNMNTIAAAGGTGAAYIVQSGNSTAFLQAMNDIRQRAMSCDYNLPPDPSTGNIDPDATEIAYKYGTNGTPHPLANKGTAAQCGSDQGFYYDDPNNPTKLSLCPTTCNLIKSNNNYKIDLTFLCKANCGETSSAVEPIPLDTYVMLDKSGSMGWGNPTRWSAVTSALKTYVGSSTANGTHMALDYFPQGDYCSLSNYTNPSVPWTPLTSGQNTFKSSLNSTHPGGGTPTRPALAGAIDYARARKAAYPQNKVVVVLATDGDPNSCSSTISNVSQVARNGYLGVGAPSVSISRTLGHVGFEDISSSGHSMGMYNANDSRRGPYYFGFNFHYMGQTYNRFWASSNGVMSLASAVSTSAGNPSFPGGGAGAHLSPMWDDWVVKGNVYWLVRGSAPNRRLIVQWKRLRHYPSWWYSSDDINFEVVLYENSGDIYFKYGYLHGSSYRDGRSSTIGIADATGGAGDQYGYNQAGKVWSGLSIRYHVQVNPGQTYPSIPTYVIGIGNVNGLNTVAANGGTGSAFIVSGGNASQFLAAMQQIRMQALGCEYSIPPSSVGGVVDPNKLTVRYTPGGTGTPQDIPLVGGPGACGSSQGFYYSAWNGNIPTKLKLCQSSCNTVGGDMHAQLNIFYDCQDVYPDGVFKRDYSAQGLCPPGSSHVWKFWSWETETPNQSSVTFTVAVADTQAGLANATQTPLKFSNPPGPSSKVGTDVVAKSGTPDTRNGAANVDTTLGIKQMNRKAPFLRVRAFLHGTPPAGTDTPTLKNWDMSISCEASE